jgi:sugar phosphate isomerase/epimerase
MRRRDALLTMAGGVAAAVRAPAEEPAPKTPRLAIGNYGMKSLPLEEAIRQIAAIGFGAFECCAVAEWDSEPARMPPNRRRAAAALLADSGLRLAAVMENLPPQADDERNRGVLARLREAISLGRDLGSGRRPLVQTVLGGGTWDDVKNVLRDRLGAWADLAKEEDATIAIKPHRFGAMSTPGQAAWLIEQLGSPERLRIVYDYSHYAFRDLSVEETIRQADGLVAYVAMKDAVRNGDKVSFTLPGEARTVDHAAIRRAFDAAGYAGYYCCEVSGQVSQQPGYDPITAAKACHRHLAATFSS